MDDTWSVDQYGWMLYFLIPIVLISLIALLRKRLEWGVYIIWIFYVFLCPFTKVEESFNVQAIHDILFHANHIDRYDHLEFPGVVPRTFAGPLTVVALCWPFVLISRAIGMTKLCSLIIVRITLASLVFVCFRRFIAAVRRSFGAKVAFWICLLTIFQFHFNFYASRPLPNIFALALDSPVYYFLALLTFSCWFNGEFKLAIWPAVFSAFVFRSELVLLYGPIFLPLLINGDLSFLNAVIHGISATVFALGITIPFDSWFWRRWLWPEGEVWYYNVVLNKSGDWGTSPFFWYFYSVLPRSLLLTLPLAPIGLYLDRRIRTILIPALIFVLAYSILPHKELRFIVYTFPLFNLASAIACNRIFENRRKSWFWVVLCMGIIGHLLVNGVASSIFARAAYGNYPGANALRSLHFLDDKRTNNVRVHIDVFSAQTGISRFLHEHDGWEYNKSESLIDGSPDTHRFDYLLIGNEDARNLTNSRKLYASTHSLLKEVTGFDRIGIAGLNERWPYLKTVELRWAPRVILLGKRPQNR